MARLKKFTMAAVVNQLRHIERTIQHPSNDDIDPKRIGMNYSLLGDRGMTSYDYFLQRKSELYCYGRSDVKVMAGWVVTAPKDLPASEHDIFFGETFNFLNERYGENNCVQAVVHADESGQPHLHYCFIPVLPDLKHGGEKICAHDLLNRSELRNFHPDLQKHLLQHGIDARIQTGITAAQGRNKTVHELKTERELKHTQTYGRSRWL